MQVSFLIAMAKFACQLFFLAFSAKKQLKSLLPIIKDDSKGRVDSQTVYNEVHEFLYLFQVFSHGAGLSKEDRADVLDALLTLDALEKDLQESWNQNRDPPVIKDSFKRALPSENEASTSSSNLAITPIKPPYKKIKFAKISPKADLLPVFECHMCVKKFSYLKTLRRHLKTAHQSDLPNEGLKEASNKVTCRICNTKQSRDQLNKHLQMTHNIKKKGLGGVLRGFWTLDDVYWYPLWLAKGEDDPPSDLMVPVQNGRITVYGNEYSVENKDVGDLVKIEDNFEQKTSQNKLSRNASNEGDTNRNKNNNGSLRDSRLDKNDNVINYTEERMESHVLNEEESEGISPNGEQACQGPSVNYCISEDGAELPTTKNSSPETTSSRSGPEAKCDEDEKLLNMEDEMAKLGYLASPEDARPHNPENIGKSFKSSAARCLSMEEFDVNDEFFNEGESFVEVAQILTPTETTIADSLKSGLQGDTNCNKTPKLLVEVFLVEVKDGTFWSAEEEEFAIDSSFEHGDSKDDSESIRDMKKAR